MSKTYIIKEVPFETEQLPIDHFAIPYEALSKDGYRFVHQQYEHEKDEIEGNPTVGDYLTKDILQRVAEYPEKATVIIDVQVGKGKTQGCYELIEEYAKDDNTIVLMLSPFRKLVEKDDKELRELRKLSVFCYKELDKKGDVPPEFVNEALDKKVHIMTINCLLGNPGEGAFAQKWSKSHYLNKLFDKCVAENKKVVMFFDEIHESIPNFLPQFVPNLFKWWQVIQTCFISSATFTAGVYPVFKYIGALTNHTFTVLSLGRRKWKADCIAKLHLHVITEEYSGSNLTPLSHLQTLLKENTDKQVNILTGHRSLAVALQKPFDTNANPNPFYEILKPFDFNVVTGSEDTEFDNTGNNIGTAFKTGVNITNPNAVMIVILPVVRENASDSIFNDGVPSIIQALARQRKGGDIHIFMYEPSVLMEIGAEGQEWIEMIKAAQNLPDTSYKPIADRLPADIVSRMASADYADQYTSLNVLWEQYNRRYDKNRIEIGMLQSLEAQGHTKLGFQYPTFEQYLMDEGGYLAAKNYHPFGGDLSSYVLWAALNRQFVNAELFSIKYHLEDVIVIKFDGADLKKSLLSHVSTDAVKLLKGANLKQTYYVIVEAIRQPKDTTSTYHYEIDGAVLHFNWLLTHPKFLRAVLEIAAVNSGISIASNELKAQYLIHSMVGGPMCEEHASQPIEHAYKRLYEVQLDFLDYCKAVMIPTKNGNVIHKDADKGMPMTIADAVKEIANVLQAEDPYIKYKGISVLQGIEKVAGAKLKTKVFNELCKVFTNITDARTTIGKERNEYYKIDGQLEKPLPNHPKLNGV